MKKNIIFDMGNVLLRFDPEYFLTREGVTGPADRKALMEAVFTSREWPMLDSGELDEADMEPIALAKLPSHLHDAARRMIWAWDDPVEPIPGMAELICECRQAGLGVYLLSNASRRQPSYWHNIPGSEWFDGAMISACERLVKPMPEIYRLLLTRFGLSAADCLFVDDMPANVEGARRVGMTGVQFTGDASALRETLCRLGFLPA